MPTRTIEWQDSALIVAGAVGKRGIELLRAIASGALPPAPIQATLGFTLTDVEEGVVRFRGEPAAHLHNPMGTVHGGWAATLLDSAMGSAVMSLLDEETGYTTLDISVRLLRPILESTGPVVAEGRIVHLGSRVATAEGRLTDSGGRTLAHGTTSCLLVPRGGRESGQRPAPGR